MFTITVDTRNGQETKEAETAAMAQVWIWELQDRGGVEFYIWDYKARRRYTVQEIAEMANAKTPP